jgi:hypothetical protein
LALTTSLKFVEELQRSLSMGIERARFTAHAKEELKRLVNLGVTRENVSRPWFSMR